MFQKYKWPIIIAVITAAIWFGLIFLAKANHTKYLEARGAEKLLREQYKVSEAKSSKEISALHASNATLEKEKQTALKDKVKERQAREKAEVNLIAEKAKTAALPDDQLSGAINLRIGAGQSKPTAAGSFTFTRPGTEATLNRFLDGETATLNYESASKEMAKIQIAFDSCESQRKNDQKEMFIITEQLKLSNAGWAKADETTRFLERSILGIKIKTFSIGVGIGGATVFGLHLAGIIK